MERNAVLVFSKTASCMNEGKLFESESYLRLRKGELAKKFL